MATGPTGIGRWAFGVLVAALAAGWAAGCGERPAEVSAPMPAVRVADGGRAFVLEGAGRPFVPWGFNYDHDGSGRLIEDYWDDEWQRVEADFREMRSLGANVVRVHLQVGRFMDGPAEPNPGYHKADVPAWYDPLAEADRWEVQARFWEAVAGRCAGSPAVFCYDLMNEPVVPGGDKRRDDWLGPAFAGKHFVQFIALDRAGRERPAIALAWIRRLRRAIRAHDRRRLITVGLVPWSLDRPGLSSGFVPERVAGELDFVSVHLYPEHGKVAEALETLRGFAVGKPVVVEETFPLKCGMEDFGRFIEASGEVASGWIGFYWGETPEELRDRGTLAAAITRKWLEFFRGRAGATTTP